MNNAIDELKENLRKKRKQGQHVIAVEYVLRKLREAEGQEILFKPPEHSPKPFEMKN